MTTGDERRGTPTLIAVSSFGEGLPRVTPLTAPGEAPLTPSALPWLRADVPGAPDHMERLWSKAELLAARNSAGVLPTFFLCSGLEEGWESESRAWPFPASPPAAAER